MSVPAALLAGLMIGGVIGAAIVALRGIRN